MAEKAFDRKFFVEQGRKGGTRKFKKVGKKGMSEQGKLGGRPRKKK